MKRCLWLVVALGAAGLALGGCDEYPASGGNSCSDDTECRDGERCGGDTCIAAPTPGGCVSDASCNEAEHCVDAICAPIVGDPATCPVPGTREELTCTDWDSGSCPCLAGIVSFHEKNDRDGASCAGLVAGFSQFLNLKQTGCHFTDGTGQLSGDAIGFEDVKLRIANLQDELPCSARVDVWRDDGGVVDRPAVRLTCSDTCTIWMEQLPVPTEERLVPDGSFLLGTPEDQRPRDRFDEAPEHQVDLTCFRINRFEVSRGEFLSWCRKYGGCDRPADREDSRTFFAEERLGLPMVGVTWTDADSFCRSNEKELPTEAEWELAARSDPMLFEPWPWGTTSPFTPAGEADCSKAIFAGCGDGPAPVGPVGGGRGRGASFYGVADLAGNVREWTRDLYRRDAYDRVVDCGGGTLCENPEEIDAGPLGAVRVVRGGSFLSEVDRSAVPADDALRVSARDHEPENAAHPDLGFRCVRYRPDWTR